MTHRPTQTRAARDATALAEDLPDPIVLQRPHDGLPFEELARRYNFRKTSSHGTLITRLIVDECRKRSHPVRVLDIGCGRGIGRKPELSFVVRRFADELWGVEPDGSVEPPQGLLDHHEVAAIEEADLPADYFDVAYSCMVMEHVSDPDGFMDAVKRCLKPGGVYLFATPNKRHYFARIASILRALHLDEFVLRLIMGRKIEDYHYPVRYRFNDEPRIDGCAGRLGFRPPEYLYIESEPPIGYQPRPLRPLFHLLTLKRMLIKNPKSLLTLVCRITRPPEAARAPA